MIPNPLPDFPSLNLERALWANGALWVAGIDEAGRGALAGPVAAAAVILPQINNFTQDMNGVRDSKLMTPTQREFWNFTIREMAVSFGVGMASSQEIDTMGILPATRLAARRAIKSLSVVPDHLLIDHFKLPETDIPQTSIPKGDRLSLSIAAASILAKTTRDAILCDLDKEFPGYGLADHKGYGTASHREAIENFGPTPIHRMTFAPLNRLSA